MNTSIQDGKLRFETLSSRMTNNLSKLTIWAGSLVLV